MSGDGKDAKRLGAREAWGIVLAAIGLLVFLGLYSYDWRDISLLRSPPTDPPANLIGRAGAWVSFVALMTFGVGAYIVPAAIALFSTLLIRGYEGELRWKILWLSIASLALVCLVELHHDGLGWANACDRLNIGMHPGGVVGSALTQPLVYLVTPVGTRIIMVAIFLSALVIAVGPGVFGALFGRLAAAMHAVGASIAALFQREPAAVEEPRRKRAAAAPRKERKASRSAAEEPDEPEEPVKRPRAAVVPDPEPLPEPEPEPAAKPAPPAPKKRVAMLKKPAAPSAAEPPAEEPEGGGEEPLIGYRLPPLDLLQELPPAAARAIHADTTTTAAVLQDTLSDFGIDAEVTNVEQGPVVTSYEVLPAAGVRVERIAALSNNIALALKATSVRVQAPIPGKGVVGIEIPNEASKIVYLREVLEGESWASGKADLPLVLGQDVGGNELVADLASMPHLLIAGSTGSGKTVCMNSVLAGLLMARTPDEMRMMLVDPKVVEFAAYNDLPQLVAPVITDAKKVAFGLRWAINEMERRYKMFAKVSVRNIKGFNSRPIEKQTELFAAVGGDDDKQGIPEKIPYIVIVIDELADLMAVAQAEIENSIARLAQLSRAVGIHMIIATQRPSVNVITGTIKANFPARIAFQVAQKVDSRTILDAQGADKLLGRGDMLFMPPSSAKLVRAQGALTSDEDIDTIVSFIKEQSGPRYDVNIKEKIEGKASASAADLEDDEDDELLEPAIEIIRETRRASTSSLQRRLRIGYNRAARLMDLVEQKGIVGPPNGSDPREILIDLDGEIEDNAEPVDQPAEMEDVESG